MALADALDEARHLLGQQEVRVPPPS